MSAARNTERAYCIVRAPAPARCRRNHALTSSGVSFASRTRSRPGSRCALIDPACGSEHFLLGAFRRLDALWARHEPGTNPRERASRVLEQVAGVDLNPFAAAIARFRLCIAALRASEVRCLTDAPAFDLRVAAGDSLLHGPRPGLAGARQEYLEAVAKDPLGHVYRTEDAEALRSILGRRYHVVVGNPPYITPKDRALNQGYRERFGSCHRKYSLAVPFTERFFDLADAPASGAAEPAGFVGMITANSFMKREFGRKLIEEFIPRWDLNHVVDTSGAYIPGHGTPTVILFGRHRRPVDGSVRAVMGIRGEPAIPDDAAKGLVWSAIVTQIDQTGSQSEFLSVSDVPRERFEKHPWSIGGGGAMELKKVVEHGGQFALLVKSIESRIWSRIMPSAGTMTDMCSVSVGWGWAQTWACRSRRGTCSSTRNPSPVATGIALPGPGGPQNRIGGRRRGIRGPEVAATR